MILIRNFDMVLVATRVLQKKWRKLVMVEYSADGGPGLQLTSVERGFDVRVQLSVSVPAL